MIVPSQLFRDGGPGLRPCAEPDLADWRRGFRFWIQQVIEGKGADQQKLAGNGCGEDLGHFPGGGRGYHARRHVSPSQQAPVGRQRAPLLAHRGESRGRRRPCAAAAAAVPGRDQRFAGTGLAQVDRRPRGRSGGAAPPVAVPGRPLRGGAARRRGRPAEACRAAVVPAAAVGRVLAGGEPVARTGARPVLGRAARPAAQGGAVAGCGAGRLGGSRKGTRWHQVLLLLATYRLLAPGSEWRLHRQWFEGSAMADLLGEDVGLAEIHKLYRCHDRLLEHKQALFDHLVGRWRDLFNVSFDVLLYDLTSTYFESDPPFPEGDKRRHGYSRDHRGDCVQVIIALVVTPEGLPLAYEVLPGNTADNTTLKDFLARIVAQYGKARRIWLMDRGVPTEAVLAEMRAADPPVQYLVGTPKGRLTRLEKGLVDKPWHDARPGVQVKLLPQDGELYVFAQSTDRVAKERAIRRRQLKWLWGRLKQLAGMKLSREELLMRLGAARKQARTAWRLIAIEVAADSAALSYRLDRAKLR